MLLSACIASAVLLAMPPGELATVSQLTEDLIASTNALKTARYPRRSHVEKPVAGTFGDALVPLLEPLKKSAEEYAALSAVELEACVAARNSAAPGRLLPPPCEALVERNCALLTALLEATHREAAGMPEGMKALSAPSGPLATDGQLRLQHGARLAALRVASLVGQEKFEEAWRVCVDTFALGRDASQGSGLVG